jgi:hypothetical protein
LVGVTYLNADGNPGRQIQFDGTVETVGPDVIAVRRGDSGELFTLPMAPESFTPAEPGEYRLRDSGRIVRDPAFVSTWNIWPSDVVEDESDG